MNRAEIPRISPVSLQETQANILRQQERRLPPSGSPIEISRQTISDLYSAAVTSYTIVMKKMSGEGGVTKWLESRAPHLGTETLNYPLINRQLERRMNAGWHLPLVFDLMPTLKHGKPRWSVIEAQTAIWHVVQQGDFLTSFNHNPQESDMWIGDKSPYDVFKNLKIEAGSEPIVIVDMNPIAAGDKVNMARALDSGLPISPLDIRRDEDGGYYYYGYEVDANGLPLLDERAGTYRKTNKKYRIHNVLTRMTQPDLDALDSSLEQNFELRSVIREFLQDTRLNWFHHPSWTYIIEKTALKDIRDQLITDKSPYAQLFVPLYTARQEVPPGNYVVKPSDNSCGVGQKVKTVTPAEKYFVEPGYVVQEKFIPYPVAVPLPDEFTDVFNVPSDVPDAMVDFFRWKSGFTPGTIELRLAFLPGYDASAVPAIKLAPRWQPSDARENVKTNLPTIEAAIRSNSLISRENRPYVPFGRRPVIIKGT